MKNILLEACVETFEEAILAEKRRADRLELCSHLELDGLTPDKEVIEHVFRKVKIPVKVMIRPRAGNFIYSESELDEMKNSIRLCKKLKVRGVVFGILDQENELNLNQIKELAQLAFPLEVTIHKAIDETPDLLKSVSELIQIPTITSILTSGGKPTAKEGREMLRKMIQLAGETLTIIPAGSITDQNLSEIDKLIGASEYHGRRIVGELT
jgi:copper homeostasis protein